MTKTKLLTFNYKSSTLKRADVRKAIKEVDAEFGDDKDDDENEGTDDKQTVVKANKISRNSKSSKKK